MMRVGRLVGLSVFTKIETLMCVWSQSVPSRLSLVCVLQVTISLTPLPAHSPLVCVPSTLASLSPSASLPLSLSHCWCFSEK